LTVAAVSDTIIVAKTLLVDGAMATSEPTRGNFQASGLDAVRLVDLIAKAAIVLAAVIYGCGFLVVSLHRHSYGLAEPNPLRPKVLAAGILFLVFAALPIVIFIEAKRFRSPSLTAHDTGALSAQPLTSIR